LRKAYHQYPNPVSQIELRAFIEMSECLPEHLGNSANDTLDCGSSTKLKHHHVTNILEWIQGCGTYMAVLARKQPERIPDLNAYQTIVIKEQLEFEGDGWSGLDMIVKLGKGHQQRDPALSGHA